MSNGKILLHDAIGLLKRSPSFFSTNDFGVGGGGVMLGAGGGGGGGRVASRRIWGDVGGLVTIIKFGAVGSDMSVLPTIATIQDHGIATFGQL
jgi:hypothetical protein